MGLLYNKQHTRIDTYSYKINSGGDLLISGSGEVEIIFENGKFVKAKYPFSGIYSRNGWRILATINKEIEEIEQALKA